MCQEFGADSRMLSSLRTMINKKPLSLSSGSKKEREAGTNVSCPMSPKGTSGMYNDRFNEKRKPTESSGANVQKKKKKESGKQPELGLMYLSLNPNPTHARLPQPDLRL